MTGKVIHKPLWVALLPSTTTDHVIVDLDNHNDVGWIYRRGQLAASCLGLIALSPQAEEDP